MAFITIKDHKENFQQALPCRLINPAKSQPGAVSRIILRDMTDKLRSATGARQLRSTADVTDWFKGIEEKERRSFLVFDYSKLLSIHHEGAPHRCLELRPDARASEPGRYRHRYACPEVAAILRWPGVVKAGKTCSMSPLVHMTVRRLVS